MLNEKDTTQGKNCFQLGIKLKEILRHKYSLPGEWQNSTSPNFLKGKVKEKLFPKG